MKKFRNAREFVVTTASGRKIADGIAIEHVEPIANRGRGRDVWRRNRDGIGYRHYRSYSA